MTSAEFQERLRTILLGIGQDRYPHLHIDWINGLPTVNGRDAGLPEFKAVAQSTNAHANDPKVEPLDERIEALCHFFLESSSSERSCIRGSVNWNIAASLLHFAWRMAVKAIRNNSVASLSLGLTAVAIENSRIDPRDTIASVGLLHHAAVRIGVDPSRYFLDTEALTGDGAGGMFSTFLGRTEHLKRPSAFGFREGTGEFGVTLDQIPVDQMSL